MRDLCVGILEHQQVASKKGKNVERAGFSVGIVEHCVRECRGMESIGLLHLTLSSLSVKWHHRQLQGPLNYIGLGTFFKKELNIIEVQISSNSRRQSFQYMGPHNLGSFLAVNSTQNYFITARMISFFVTFATKVPYLTFCDKMRQFLI